MKITCSNENLRENENISLENNRNKYLKSKLYTNMRVQYICTIVHSMQMLCIKELLPATFTVYCDQLLKVKTFFT